MTYDPTIPANTHKVYSDRALMQTNFDQANTLIAKDHYAFNDGTSNFRAYHKTVTFPEVQPSDPAIGANQGIFYTKADTNDTNLYAQLFWENQYRQYQITNGFYSPGTTSGYYMLPLGRNTVDPLVVIWGREQIVDPSTVVTFPPLNNYDYGALLPASGFKTNCFHVQLTIQCNSASDYQVTVDRATDPPSRSKFRFNVSGSISTTAYVYWLAIGN